MLGGVHALHFLAQWIYQPVEQSLMPNWTLYSSKLVEAPRNASDYRIYKATFQQIGWFGGAHGPTAH